MNRVVFEWDEEKDKENRNKHNVSFSEAQLAFLDPCRVIAEDVKHSLAENRFYCIGRVGEGIMTVRFYISPSCYSYLRRWILEKRKENI